MTEVQIQHGKDYGATLKGLYHAGNSASFSWGRRFPVNSDSIDYKSRRADLNRGPADYESAALPTELRRQKNAHPGRVSNSCKEKKDRKTPSETGSKAPMQLI